MALFSILKKPTYPADADGPTPDDVRTATAGSFDALQEMSAKEAKGGRSMPSPTDIPVQHIVNMRNQGMSNNQIIQNLQRFGYTIDQINNALNQADIKTGIYPTQPSFAGSASMSQGPSGQPSSMSSSMSSSFGSGPAAPRSSPSFAPSSGSFGSAQEELSEELSDKDERMHEIAESIIEEKWNELMDSVSRIIEWKDGVETRLAKVEQQLTDVRGSFDKLHEGVLGKLGDYDKGISTVTVEIKALEKVFQKILPGFVENVHELSKITEKMKGR